MACWTAPPALWDGWSLLLEGSGRLTMREFDLIATLFAPLATHAGALGLRDDAALWPAPPPGHHLVMTKDMLAANVHFLADDPPADIAAKLLRVNLSDLAAMGATPGAVLLGLGLTGEETAAWLAAFAAGLKAELAHFGVALLGGDTVSGLERLTLSLTAIGTVPAESVLHRHGAQAGDDVYVSGTLGDAVLGLRALRGLDIFPDPTPLIARYRRPEPRLALGQALGSLATAAMDISDGLLADARHIAQASNVALHLWLDAVPLSPGAQLWTEGEEARRLDLVTAGDDYELLFTAPPTARPALLALSQSLGVHSCRIGQCRPGKGVTIVNAKRQELAVLHEGYEHGRGGNTLWTRSGPC